MLHYSVCMLNFVTSLFRLDPQHKKYLKLAGFLLVFGYLSLLAFVYVAFNKYDFRDDDPKPNATTRADRTSGQT